MTYKPINWKDRIVEKPNTFETRDNGDNTVTLIPDPGQVLQEGTPLNAENLNHIEKGLIAAYSQLEQIDNKKLNKTDVLSMANMGQDVKEAMTGGSVAVVGEYAVDTINVKNNAITFSKKTPLGDIGYIFSFKGKEPNFDTTNKTLTIQSNSPIIHGLNVYNSLNPNPTIVDLKSYIGDVTTTYVSIWLDTTLSNKNTIKINVRAGNIDKNNENEILLGQANIGTDDYIMMGKYTIDGKSSLLIGNIVEKNNLNFDFNNEVKTNIESYINGTFENRFNKNNVKDGGFYDGGYNGNLGNWVENSTVSQSEFINLSSDITKIKLVLPQDGRVYQCVFKNSEGTIFKGFYKRSEKVNDEFIINVPNGAVSFSSALYTIDKDKFYIYLISKNSINEKLISVNSYSNLRMNALGDSITWGYIPDVGTRMENPWTTILKDRLGLAECRNYGISGSTLAKGDNPMCERYLSMDDDAQIVCVFGGTNDYGRTSITNPNLGTINDTTSDSIYGAMDVLCKGLIKKYPKAIIFFITPLKRADKTNSNSKGYTLNDVVNAEIEVCKKYSIPVLDLFNFGGYHPDIADFNNIYGGNDKLHPNQKWIEEHLSVRIEKFIKTLI